MKLTLLLPIAFLASCAAVDLQVDKSQIKAETEEYIIVSSKAVTPVVNAEEVNRLVQEKLDEVIITASK